VISRNRNQPHWPANALRGWLLAAMVLAGLAVLATARTAEAAQDSTAVKTALRLDSTQVAVRLISEAELSRFRGDPEFDYNREHAGANTLWQRITSWLFGSLSRALAATPMAPLLQYLPYFIMAGAFYLLVTRLHKSQAHGLFARRESAISPDSMAEIRDIQTVDFRAAIDAAIAEKAYRRAVRLLYLDSLRLLAQTGAIAWHLEKTNHDYLRELRDPHLKQPFSELTCLFEYTWYGEFALEMADFRQAHEKFRSFEGLVARQAPSPERK